MHLHRTEGKDPGGSVTDAWSGRPSQPNVLDWASICLLIFFFFLQATWREKAWHGWHLLAPR